MSVDYKKLFEQAKAKLKALSLENEALKAEIAAAPPKDGYVYYFFDPWSKKRSIYGGVASLHSNSSREEDHMYRAIGRVKTSTKNDAFDKRINAALKKGGIGIIRLVTGLWPHEAKGAESAVLAHLLSEGDAVNKCHGSRQGSYATLSPKQLQEAGQKLIQDGIEQWEADGRPVYVIEITKKSPKNAKLFEDYVTKNIILKICCAGSKCSRAGQKVRVGVTGFCSICLELHRKERVDNCSIIVLGKRCPEPATHDGKCRKHYQRIAVSMRRGVVRDFEEFSKIKTDFINETAATCGHEDCKLRLRSSLRIKHDKHFYHAACFAKLYVPDMPANQFEGFNELGKIHQETLKKLFPGKSKNAISGKGDQPDVTLGESNTSQTNVSQNVSEANVSQANMSQANATLEESDLSESGSSESDESVGSDNSDAEVVTTTYQRPKRKTALAALKRINALL